MISWFHFKDRWQRTLNRTPIRVCEVNERYDRWVNWLLDNAAIIQVNCLVSKEPRTCIITTTTGARAGLWINNYPYAYGTSLAKIKGVARNYPTLPIRLQFYPTRHFNVMPSLLTQKRLKRMVEQNVHESI